MRRDIVSLVGVGCFLALLLYCYHSVLFEDGQFALPDAANFYYPLYLRVQQEWNAGRWPLWDPGTNGGAPMLGNPMAAVLYPGKVLYALLPYPWAARLYVIAHTSIAFLGLLALGRSLGVSRVGSHLGALSYAFGAPILYQYGNVIFLVGAAWTPWGLAAIDRLLRLRRWRGAVELAAVLALQVLGGDPEAAYLMAVCGAAYAVVLVISARDRPAPLLTGPRIVGALCVWVAATLGLAAARLAPPRFLATNLFVVAAWVAALLGLAWHWRRYRGQARLAPLMARLAAACTLAMALAAAQILPVLEFVGKSRRVGGEVATNVQRYRFSLAPVRLVELVWPTVFGTPRPENRSWLQGVPPAGDHEFWVDSLYIGGPALALAVSAAGWRSGRPWRAWLTAIAVVGLVASFGKYGGPLWWARWGPFDVTLGPHDPLRGRPRFDPYFQDSAGSLYSVLVMLLPGFGAFRYPSKFLTFFTAALAVLAGVGWDRVTAGDVKRLRCLVGLGLGASLVGLGFALAAGARAVAYLDGRVVPDSIFGPADAAGAWAETQRALAHGALVFAAVLALAHWAPRSRGAGALALLLLASDLAVANARLICTVPQTEFEAPAEAARLIEAAERTDPASGPYRIHRMWDWHPIHFGTKSTAQRLRELNAWDRETLSPLFALPLGLEYCATIGSLELEDYVALFSPQAMPAPAGMARALGVREGQPVTYFPRRCFDLWGARYFLLPASPDWGSRERGFASFLDQTELIHPHPDRLRLERDRASPEPWVLNHDWQLRRNRAAYPRAWLVHHARVRPPAREPDARAELIRSLAFANDRIWNDPGRTILDPRAVALIETDDAKALKGYIYPSSVGPKESVAVVKHEPQRVELRASLDHPGLVILADTFYPGWRLTIDGRPAPIFQANRLMRGAPVASGRHTLVYKYEPGSFRLGAMISTAGLIVLSALAWSTRRQPVND